MNISFRCFTIVKIKPTCFPKLLRQNERTMRLPMDG